MIFISYCAASNFYFYYQRFQWHVFRKKRNSFYTHHNKIQLVKGDSPYFNLLKQLIEKANHSAYIRIYIWDDDPTGTLIDDQLIKSAQKNIAVFIIADGYASQCLSKEFKKHLRNHRIF